jgi:hypothetical protein
MSREDHWNSVYSTKAVNEVSWFADEPQPSSDLILQTLPEVDRLSSAGVYEPAVLDISQVAVDHARTGLAAAAEHVRRVVCEVTKATSIGEFDLRHDNAVDWTPANTVFRRWPLSFHGILPLYEALSIGM